MTDNLTQEERNTINYYDQHAQEWSDKNSGGTRFDPDMEELFKLVPSGKLLEIGAGHGEDAQKLIRHFGVENYTGVEPAKGLLQIARERVPDGNFIQAGIYDIDFPTNSFDAFWVCAMLIHLHKDKLHDALVRIHNVVKDGAYGFVSVMEGDADMQESRPGRFYSLWGQEEFEKELKSAGFKIIRKRRIEQQNGNPWLAYILEKSGS